MITVQSGTLHVMCGFGFSDEFGKKIKSKWSDHYKQVKMSFGELILVMQRIPEKEERERGERGGIQIIHRWKPGQMLENHSKSKKCGYLRRERHDNRHAACQCHRYCRAQATRYVRRIYLFSHPHHSTHREIRDSKPCRWTSHTLTQQESGDEWSH